MTASLEAPARQDTTCRAGRPAVDPLASQRALWRRQAAARRKQLALGQPTTDLIDATPAREHVNALRAQGMGWQRIAAQAGIPEKTVFAVLWRRGRQAPNRRIRRQTADALLAVRLDPAVVPVAGTHRRVQALVALGWSLRTLSQELGHAPVYLARVLRSDSPVTHATADKVRGLYERLWDQQPPENTPGERQSATVARRLAERRGWVVPMAWSDDAIDDPNAQPDTGADDGPAPIDLDEVDHLAAAGVHIDEIARRLGVGVGGIKQARWRAGRAS